MSQQNESMVSLVSYLIETTEGLLLKPVETFQKNTDTSFSLTFQYFVILTVINAVLSVVILASSPYSYSLLQGSSVLYNILIAILGSVIGLFIFGLIQHIFVLLMGGKYGLEQTLKVIMYSAVPGLVLGWIASFFVTSTAATFDPFTLAFSDWQTMAAMGTVVILLSIILFIWQLVLLVLGISELHRMSTTSAIAAVLLPYVILFLIGVIFGLAVMSFFI